ncbi:Nucleoporin [Penicillium rolfsii]|nr:Nucleoporin [Penicillium rolfsii]
MFVPKTAATSRNPRRRQRTSSDDSVKPPKAKRQRSVLRQTGDSQATSLNHDQREVAEPAISALASEVVTTPLGAESHLPIRSAKQPEGSANDAEGTVVLSSTNYYTVEQLPALPDQIRGSLPDPFRCFFAPSHHYALALTPSHAIIWPYSVTMSTPSASETFTVSIPEACRNTNGAVPLGVLLSTATGGHPGLLVIIPNTGRIIYWETVSSAASLGLSRQKQSGIQGSTPGLLSGEYATEIMNCEPSGIVVVFSSGRVAHVTLRDPQGKPSVLVNFLSTSISGGAGGFLGGIKNVLGGGSWRKEVTAVRAGGSRQRGQRDVIVATSSGRVEIWDTHWNHGNALKKIFDVRGDISVSIPPDFVKSSGETELKILDFAFSEQQVPGEDDLEASEESWRLFVLVSTPQLLESQTLFIVQVLLSGSSTRVLATHAVDIHNIPAVRNDLKPKILVSKGESTAFVLIGQSLVVLSLTSIEETPTSQLLLDSHQMPLPFQDIIHLRSGKDYEILGYSSEDKPDYDESSTACVMMVRNFGVVRVNVVPQFPSALDADESQITAKHKLEQAIFFGTMSRNPLNLVGDTGLDFPAIEIEQASLDICKELLRSESRFVPTSAISIDQNLRLRAKALGDLAALLLRKGNPLSRPARWELLWGAEKLAAQRAMWKLEEAHRSGGEGAFLSHVIESMNDKFKTLPSPSSGEADLVRLWFLKDTHHMEHVIPWIKNAIKPRRGNSSKQARKLSEQILQASEHFLAIIETAYRYRDEHASVYGLGSDFVEDGVLADGYENLPEFWTSRAVGYTEAGHLLDWELDSCRAWIQQKTSSADAPDSQVLKKIAENSARHLRVLGQMHRERTRWLSAQDDPKLADECVAIEQSHVKERKWQLFKLAGIGHLRDALSLAERFRDMGALVELIIELQDQVKTQSGPDSSVDAPVIAASEADVAHRVSQYFDRFGELWADAYFSRQISMGHPGALLSMRKYQPFVTRFLRKQPTYSRMSWINDVTGEEDYETAAACLEGLALGGEKDLWNHRVQLSLAKLSKLASSEKKQFRDQSSSLEEDVNRLDDCNEIDEIQDSLHTYVKSFCEDAIDRRAAADLALGYFGGHLAADRPSLHKILDEALFTLFNRRVVGVDGLIDLLTLMGPFHHADEIESDFGGREIFLAFRVLDYSRYAERDPSYVSALRKVIWRRCMIKDDWESRGKAAEGSNGASDDSARDTALYQTLSLCLSTTCRPSLQSLVAPLSPVEVLMAESEPDILVSRFRPEQQARVKADLKREDELLRRFIEIGKLDFWFQNILTSVKTEKSSGARTDGNAAAA